MLMAVPGVERKKSYLTLLCTQKYIRKTYPTTNCNNGLGTRSEKIQAKMIGRHLKLWFNARFTIQPFLKFANMFFERDIT